jgi:SAM-dependent methyltransferase
MMSIYYRKSVLSSLAESLTIKARSDMFDEFLRVMKPTPDSRVLDLGVTSENEGPGANYFDYKYPYQNKLTCAGLQDATYLCKDIPSIKYVKLVPDDGRLPFADNEFDIVHCNAVIEHVGSTEKQIQFAREIARVSKKFFVTTPNRWFPIEMHTHVPFIHYLPKNLFRNILGYFGEDFYSKESNLNLLKSSEFMALFPVNYSPSISYIWCCGFISNIIVYGCKQ